MTAPASKALKHIFGKKISLRQAQLEQTHRVALLGFGTVGQGFAEIVQNKRDFLLSKYGLNLKIVAVSDFNKGAVYHPDGLDIPKLLQHNADGKSFDQFGQNGCQYGFDGLTTCGDSVQADTLLEMTYTNLEDGMPAINHVEKALRSGKNVITTNKGPVVFGYDHLDEVAREHGKRFMIEGAIMSGTPIVSLMRNIPAANFTEISGILNGTCNYILSSMEFEGVDFEPALKEAQRLGYAEANPAFDIGGGDARAKAIILCRILGDKFDTSKIHLEGIENITRDMVMDAKARGKRYKLVSQLLFDESNKIKSIEVKPIQLDVKTDSLANVGGCLNALNFKSDMLGSDLTMVGPGAGKIETGYSLFSDLLYLNGCGSFEA